LLHLKDISLVHFKNYKQAAFGFRERIVGICGNNGVGKTNLLDAIYYLCFTKSYFTKSDQANVLKGEGGFRIEGHFDGTTGPDWEAPEKPGSTPSGEGSNTSGENEEVICILRETGKKEFSLNGTPYEKFSMHIGRFPCVIIAPDDVQIITGGSEERRRSLDALLSQLDPGYLQYLITYNKVLQQRNGFLKSLSGTQVQDKHLLDVYDEQLIRPGNYIFEKRKEFLHQFLPRVKQFYLQIAGIGEPVELTYESQLQKEDFRGLLRRFRDKDWLLQRTGAGIHKDDIELSFSAQPFKAIASQGQRKSLLFALKLAEYETLKQAKGTPPLLLLDDVFEKLDEHRMHNLLDKVCLRDKGQVFITDTHSDRIKDELEKLAVPFQIITL